MNYTVMSLTSAYWDELAETEDRPIDRIVHLRDADPSEQYAWSPDGRGATYFASKAELLAAVDRGWVNDN